MCINVGVVGCIDDGTTASDVNPYGSFVVPAGHSAIDVRPNGVGIILCLTDAHCAHVEWQAIKNYHGRHHATTTTTTTTSPMPEVVRAIESARDHIAVFLVSLCRAAAAASAAGGGVGGDNVPGIPSDVKLSFGIHIGATKEYFYEIDFTDLMRHAPSGDCGVIERINKTHTMMLVYSMVTMHDRDLILRIHRIDIYAHPDSATATGQHAAIAPPNAPHAMM